MSASRSKSDSQPLLVFSFLVLLAIVYSLKSCGSGDDEPPFAVNTDSIAARADSIAAAAADSAARVAARDSAARADSLRADSARLAGPVRPAPPSPGSGSRLEIQGGTVEMGEGSFIEMSGGGVVVIDGDTVAAGERVVLRGGAGRAPGATRDADRFIPAAEALWAPLGAWSGRGGKETERFRAASDEWRLVVRSRTEKEGPSQVRVTVLKVAAGAARGGLVTYLTVPGGGADTSYVHEPPGLFYLRVESVNARWTLAAEEKRVPAEALPARP